MKKKFYITTTIYYVNDRPHIGHAYTNIVADALARFHRLKQESVYFVTGTDENSQKNVQAMEKAGESDLMTYLDRMAGEWEQTWKDLQISNDDFIRTTEERHRKGVEQFWKAVEKNGDIYSGEYVGLYCIGCEAFKTEAEIVNGRCQLHPNKDLEKLKEKNYFFRLSAYREKLLKLYEEGSSFVMPEARRHEIHNYVAEHLTDISISRAAKVVPVGIPVPGDDSQRIYVWFDALINYLTAVGYGTDDKMFQEWWPADLHLVGKDIIKFHAALWPAMLMSAGLELPTQVYAHGFFTINGQKISKSLGNAVDPRTLMETYGVDPLRYFLLREVTFGEDGDFSDVRLKERYDSDLGNTFGNLVNRAIAMSKKYFDGKVADIDPAKARKSEMGSLWAGEKGLKIISEQVTEAYENSRCDVALTVLWGDREAVGSTIMQANKYIEDTQPFKKENEAIRAPVLYALLEACRQYAWMIAPVMPETANKVFTQLGLDPKEELAKGWEKGLEWGGLKPGSALGEPQPLFPRGV